MWSPVQISGGPIQIWNKNKKGALKKSGLAIDQQEKLHLLHAIQNSAKCSSQGQLGSQRVCNPDNASFAEVWLHLLLPKASSSRALSVPFWLEKCKLKPDLNPNLRMELISPDKGLHCDFACLMYSKLANCLLKGGITNIKQQHSWHQIGLFWTMPSPWNSLEWIHTWCVTN